MVYSLREGRPQGDQWDWCDGEERSPYLRRLQGAPLCGEGEGFPEEFTTLSYLGRKTFLSQEAIIQHVDLSPLLILDFKEPSGWR